MDAKQILDYDPLSYLDAVFMMKVVQVICRDSNLANQYLEDFPVAMLEGEWEWLFTQILEIFHSSGRLPTPRILYDLLAIRVNTAVDRDIKEEFDRDVARSLFLNAAEQILLAPISHSPADVLTEYKPKIKQMLFKEFIRANMVEAMTEDKIDEFIENLGKKVSAVSNKKLPSFYADTYQDSIRKESRQVERIPTGLQMLDTMIGGGLRRQDVALIMAPTGAGKTSFLTFYAASAAQAGYRVGYITMEIPESSIQNMITASVTGINRKNLEMHFFKMGKVERRLMEKFDDIPRIWTWDYGPKELKATDIPGLIDQVSTYWGETLDLLVVDYVNEFAMNYGRRPEDQVVGEQISYLKGIAKRYDMAIWTAQQANREALKKEVVDMSNLARSYAQSWQLDLFLGLSGTAKQRAKQYGVLNIGKCRLAELPSGKNTVLVDLDFGRVQFRGIDRNEAIKRGINAKSAKEGGVEIDAIYFEESKRPPVWNQPKPEPNEDAEVDEDWAGFEDGTEN